MQASVSALRTGDGVVWIGSYASDTTMVKSTDYLMADAATPFSSPRFEQVLQAQTDGDIASSNGSARELYTRFKHYTIPTLAHLLALFLHPMPNFPPTGTGLIVIESISTLFDNAYNRTNFDRSKTQTDAQKWAAGRKFAVMGELMTKLSRLATVNSTAILVTSQTVTRVRSGQGALLLPAISGSEWDNGVSTQLVLFRDWAPKRGTQLTAEEAEKWHRLRYAGVIKVKGVALEENGLFDTVVPFSIEQVGIVICYPSSTANRFKGRPLRTLYSFVPCISAHSFLPGPPHEACVRRSCRFRRRSAIRRRLWLGRRGRTRGRSHKLRQSSSHNQSKQKTHHQFSRKHLNLISIPKWMTQSSTPSRRSVFENQNFLGSETGIGTKPGVTSSHRSCYRSTRQQFSAKERHVPYVFLTYPFGDCNGPATQFAYCVSPKHTPHPKVMDRNCHDIDSNHRVRTSRLTTVCKVRHSLVVPSQLEDSAEHFAFSMR